MVTAGPVMDFDVLVADGELGQRLAVEQARAIQEVLQCLTTTPDQHTPSG